MSHPENLTHYDHAILHIENSWQEAFRMAERMVFKAVARVDWKDDVSKDRYLSSIPALAMNLHSTFASLASMIQQVSPKEIDNVLEASREMIDAVKRRNDTQGE